MRTSPVNDTVGLAATTDDREAVGGRDESHADGWTRETDAFLNRMGASARAREAYEAWFRTRRGEAGGAGRPVPAGGETRHLRAGGRLVTCYGWGTGPVVLLVHGLGGNAGQLAHFVAPLTRAGYRAVAIDAPGHGRSEGRGTDVLEVERALLAVRDAYGALHGVVAFSLGCTWSLWALSRGLTTGRIVCIAPVARQSFLYETFVRRHRLSSEVAGELVRLHHARYGPFEEYDTTKLCRSVESPAIILHDLEDAMIPPGEGGARLAEAWKGSTFVATRGLGHFGMIREPAVVSRVVRFLDEAS